MCVYVYIYIYICYNSLEAPAAAQLAPQVKANLALELIRRSFISMHDKVFR